jgi:hypothetical protein
LGGGGALLPPAQTRGLAPSVHWRRTSTAGGSAASPGGCRTVSAAAFVTFLRESLGNAARTARDGAIAFVCMDWRHMEELIAAGRQTSPASATEGHQMEATGCARSRPRSPPGWSSAAAWLRTRHTGGIGGILAGNNPIHALHRSPRTPAEARASCEPRPQRSRAPCAAASRWCARRWRLWRHSVRATAQAPVPASN